MATPVEPVARPAAEIAPDRADPGRVGAVARVAVSAPAPVTAAAVRLPVASASFAVGGTLPAVCAALAVLASVAMGGALADPVGAGAGAGAVEGAGADESVAGVDIDWLGKAEEAAGFADRAVKAGPVVPVGETAATSVAAIVLAVGVDGPGAAARARPAAAIAS